MSAAPPSQDYRPRCLNLRSALEAAESRWGCLEQGLVEAEEDTLQAHAEALQGWLGLEPAELTGWGEGGVRRAVRDRVFRLVLAPLAGRLLGELELSSAHGFEHGRPEQWQTAIGLLLLEWDNQVAPLLRVAEEEQARLDRKLRRSARVAAADAPGVPLQALQICAGAWARVRQACGPLEGPVEKLQAFLERELSPGAVQGLRASVPAIVGRAACDWRFRTAAAELEQLEGWWGSVRTALGHREPLWQRLQEEEGLFIRRVDEGVASLRESANRYDALADFGGEEIRCAQGSRTVPGVVCGEWPGHAVALLAQTASEMHRCLRPIRDSAAWRVVDAARSIHKELAAAGPHGGRGQGDGSGVSQRRGVDALCAAIDISAGPPAGSALPSTARAAGGDPVDAALVFMQRLDRLVALVCDLRDHFRREAPPCVAEVHGVLEEVLQGFGGAAEDLLGVMDDATADSVAAWLQQWRDLDVAAAGSRLEAALRALSASQTAAACGGREGPRRLAELRGLQAFLEDAGLRCWAVAPEAARGGEGAAAEAGEEEGPPPAAFLAWGADCDLSLPAPPAVAPPEGLAEPACATFLSRRLGPGAAAAAAVAAAAAAVTPAAQLDVNPGEPRGAPAAAEGTAVAAAAVPRAPQVPCAQDSRPSTPSWLTPPWPRPSSGADAVSTAFGEGEAITLARWKHVGGQEFVPLKKSATRGRQLPPLPALVR
ncbi:unnamed protein product [Prorocentrum cordatum]|uniref:Uncharacterized protein n=1 Tax=Prorocentrum cordatum TaxID=2364126 RepID=A0ABN9RQZ0_9DINO|nr:unnamed protein product [Polarella glacialis]